MADIQPPVKPSERLFRSSLCLFRILLLILLGLGLGGSPTFSQQSWTRTYGGTLDDVGYSVRQTLDGGYIITGWTRSFGSGGEDVYLIKTDASGNPSWSRTYGGTNNDEGHSVQQTSDGGYIIAGNTNSFGAGNWDFYLIKTDASGNPSWSRAYGGTNIEAARSVQQTTADGGYIIVGWTTSFGAGGGDVYLIKTDASGNPSWTRTYGGIRDDLGYSVQQTSDGGYIITGWTKSVGDTSGEVYIIKTDASGNLSWSRAYGGASNDEGHSVRQTQDGGYIIAGQTYSFGAGGCDVYLIKTDASGNLLWTRTYGGTLDDQGWSVWQTLNGGYIISGNAKSFGAGAWDVYVVRTNASGDILWTKTYGGTLDDAGRSAQQTSDGGVIITGWTLSFGSGGGDVYLIKTTDPPSGVEEEQGSRIQGSKGQGLKITPNPFSSFATLPGHEAERFRLYDISGRKVGTYKGDRIGEGLAPGVYFLRQQDRLGSPVRVVKVR